MDPQQLDLPPPKNWQDFQDLCHALWGHEWNCPTIQKNGRLGQTQKGVDIFGQPNGGLGFRAIQCKVKSRDAVGNPELSESEVRAEVDEALKFTPPLEGLIVATTAPQDAKIQAFARRLTEQNARAGLFSVDVLSWPEIVARLVKYDDLLERFYPGASVRWTMMVGQVAETHAAAQRTNATLEMQQDDLKQILSFVSRLDADRQGIDEFVNRQIDQCRELMNEHKPMTAIRILEELLAKSDAQINDKARFRILTNVGTAKLLLNDIDGTGDAFVLAWNYAKGDEKADSNRAFGLLLKNKVDDARAAAIEAGNCHANSGKPIAVLIACAIHDKSLTDPLTLVPSSLLDNPDVMFAVAGAYRFLKRGEEAVQWAEKVYQAEASLKNRRFRAEALLTRLEVPSVTVGGQLTPQQKGDLETATQDLETCWNELRTTEEARGDPSLAATLISCHMLGGNMERAAAICTEVLSIVPDFEPVLRQAATIAIHSQELGKALDFARRLRHLPERGIMIAETLEMLKRFDEARIAFEEIVANPPDDKIKRYAVEGRIRLEAIINDTSSAILMSETIGRQFPNDVGLISLSAEMYLKNDNTSKALDCLHDAAGKVTHDTPYHHRVILAQLLRRVGENSLAVKSYRSVVNTNYDSPLLRQMIGCMYDGDLRGELHSLFAELNRDIMLIPFYSRMKALSLDGIGRRQEAFDHLVLHLSENTDDIPARLHWIQLAEDLGHTKQLRTFLEQSADLPGASAYERMALAQCLKRHGLVEEGLKLGYEVLRRSRDQADINLGFVGLMLQRPQVPLDAAIVDVDMSFKLEDGRMFVIEASDILDRMHEVKPDHPLAKSALGAKVGDEIVVAVNPYQQQKAKVVDLMHKYVRAHVEILESFQLNFPGHTGLMAFSLGSDAVPQTDAVVAALEDQAEAVAAALAMYSKGVAICLVASLLGHHPIRVWQEMVHARNERVRCSRGTDQERTVARTLLHSSSGFVVDPLTLFVLHVLGVADCLSMFNVPVGVTTTTIESLVSFRSQLKEHEKEGLKTLGEHAGKLIANVVPADLVTEEIHRIDRILEWVDRHCDRVDAVGDLDLSGEAREAVKSVDPAFMDTARAAMYSGRLIVADDLNYRDLLKSIGVTRSVGVEDLVRSAVKIGKLDYNSMATALENMILANYDHVSLDFGMLRRAAERDGWALTPRLKRLLAELGKADVDLSSAAGLAMRIIAQTIVRVEDDAVRAQFIEGVVGAFDAHFRDQIPALWQTIRKLMESTALTAKEHERRATSVASSIGLSHGGDTTQKPSEESPPDTKGLSQSLTEKGVE